METKKFTVFNPQNMTKKVFDSNATTFGELKAELRNLGINVEGMTVQEGLTNTELLSDNTVLPTNVPFHGTTTNNLVFRILRSKKNIESGNPRKDLYDVINEKNLKEVIAAHFGRNYTQVKTEDLQEFINNYNPTCACAAPKEKEVTIEQVKNALLYLVTLLEDEEFISELDGAAISEDLSTDTEEQIYTLDQITEMFKDI